MNIAQLAEQSAARLGERMVLDFEGQTFTNWQLLDQSRRLQSGLTRLGLRQSGIVAMCMMNHPTVYPVFQGIFRCGGTALPTMFTLTEVEIRYILQDSCSQGVVTDAVNLSKITAAAQGLDHIHWIAALGVQDDPQAMPPVFRLETLFEEEPSTSFINTDVNEVAVMLYTSGTTGHPKGVMLTHRNLYASALAANKVAESERQLKPQISLSALPMAHIFGVGVMNGGYLSEGQAAEGYCVQMGWFEPERFMQLIEQHHCTTIPVVPAMLIYILNHPKLDQYDLSSMEEVITGAAPLPVEVAAAFQKKFNCRVRELYGQTESAGIGSANRPSILCKPGSVGLAYDGTDLQIFDDDDRPVPVGTKGEIVLRGPSVMKGYFNNSEATQSALKGGWLHTGDVGYLDEEGYLFIVDRKKDMIIKGGENIYSAELEEIVYGLPGIAEAAVVGKPDSVFGETVVAYLVVRPGFDLTEEQVRDCFVGKVSGFKVPSEINFIDSLPKSPVGKVLKRELRERAAKK